MDESGKLYAATTDYDYFSREVNHFWEMGYLYATLRWLRKISPAAANTAENETLAIIEDKTLKEKFMFYLGTLSSYCGYRDSLFSLVKRMGPNLLIEERVRLSELDKLISLLARKIL